MVFFVYFRIVLIYLVLFDLQGWIGCRNDKCFIEFFYDGVEEWDQQELRFLII